MSVTGRKRRVGPTQIVACPSCGRGVRQYIEGHLPPHYSALNPPIRGAWYMCPGPTSGQKRRAAQWYP